MRGQLRPTDPRRLGRYRLEAVLGQGGMGTVYLGRSDEGRPVAVKVIKAELAYDREFRGRFRSEVNRARQVPPFCTAEVIDADADHETPYLVTEYVDGPSLAEVVREQGPLTGGSLHSVAVGVATALAAIHGAGVIHRDLKPHNVLFALGTPKVIDFGIARAFEATSQHTATDQMVGTVAYMAPERFDTTTDRALGPAADVFAWGVVVAYAGTGRTPFNADSPVATAARILTQPPNLAGLPEPLRELVAASLDKDPGRRPTAADLLDRLVATGAPDLSAQTLATRAAQQPWDASRGDSAATRGGPVGGGPVGGGPGSGLAGVAGSGAPDAGTVTRTTSRRWRRAAPVLAAVAVIGVAAALFAFTPVRDLLPAGASAPETSDPAVAAPAPIGSASSGASASPSIGPAPSAVTSRRTSSAPKPAGDGGGVTITASPATRVRLCGNADITVSISAQNDDTTVIGTQRGLVNVVNKSRTSCRVDGRAFFRLYNAADERVDVPTTSVSEPDPAIDITLRAGAGAFEGIKWQACDIGDGDCPTGNTIRGSLVSSADGVVADLDGFPAPEDSRITMSSLQLGTLQPSAEGVVAW
jgi:predicted Ser/Thr protein kinase